MKKTLFTILTLCLALIVSAPMMEAQSKKNQPKDFTLYGNVKSVKGHPLMGVEISVQDSFIKTTSDENGDFEIKIPNNGSVLVFYTPYYVEHFQTISSSDYLQIELKEAEAGQGARDKVNMPYWTTQKRNVTASLNTITSDDLDKAKVISIGNALQGRVLGMTSRLLAGAPGREETTYLIRGNRTLNGAGTTGSWSTYGVTDPLIIVDGFERTFETLDPHEIESLSILRDAAATSIYGNRGANGVILVNTKHGETNKRQIDFNYFEGVANPIQMPEYVDAATYAEWYNEARVNDGLSPVYSEKDIALYKSGESPLTHPNTDFYGELLNKTSAQRRATLSMKGGNQIARYFVLFGYSFQDGLFKTNQNPAYGTDYNYTKYNLRSNIDVNITKWLTMEMNMSNRIRIYNNPGATISAILNAMHDPANAYPLYFTGIDPDLQLEKFMLGGDSVHKSNPYGLINYHGYSEKTERYYQASAKFKADFAQFGLKGFTAEIAGHLDGYNYYNIEKSQNYQVWKYSTDYEGKDVYTQYGTESSLSTSTYYDIQRLSGLDGKLKYENSFGDHKFSVMGLYTMERTTTKLNNSPDYRYENMAAWANYSYKNKYFVDLTAAYAGSDKFYYTNHRRELYPSVGLGWIISSEDFLKSADWLNYLKLRASWGISGNNEYTFTDVNGDAERYPARVRWWCGSMQKFGTALTSFTTTSEGRAPNEDITVEKGAMSNIALETNMFNHRLYFEVDLWKEHRYDIYTASSGICPRVYGAVESNMAITNNGIVDSRGIEVEMSWTDKIGDFSYGVLGQFAYNDATIVAMGEAYREYENLVQTGNRPRMDYGLKCIGFFKDWDDIANSPTQLFGTVNPGDLKYEDVNKDGQVDSNDKVPVGSGRDPRMQGNLVLNVGYKNFGFDILLQGTSCMSSYLYADSNRAFYDNGTAQYWMANRAIIDADGNVSNWDTVSYPRFTTQASENNWQCSDFWEVNASYIRLKNVEIYYNLPSKFLKAIRAEKAKVYFSSYNPYTWSYAKAYNVDAEDWLAGIERYPRTRTFNIGIDLTF